MYLKGLDVVRGMAALAVCLYHAVCGNNLFEKSDLIFQIFQYGFLGVEAFFIISGIVIPLSMYKADFQLRNIGTFLWKRMVRIEPPYLVSICLILLLNFVVTLAPLYKGVPFKLDFYQIISHLGYVNALVGLRWLNPVYWTLALEFQYYILIALIFPLVVTKNKFLFYVTMIIINGIGIFYPNANLIFSSFTYFTLGIILFRYLVGIDGKWTFVISTFIVLSYVFYEGSYPFLITCLICYPFVLWYKSDYKVLAFFGMISYSLYLLHCPIGGKFINLAMNFSHSEFGKYIILIFSLIISILVSYIYYLLIEKPSQKLAKKISYKKI